MRPSILLLQKTLLKSTKNNHNYVSCYSFSVTCASKRRFSCFIRDLNFLSIELTAGQALTAGETGTVELTEFTGAKNQLFEID